MNFTNIILYQHITIMDSVSLMMRNKSEVKLKAVVILVLKGISKLDFTWFQSSELFSGNP